MDHDGVTVWEYGRFKIERSKSVIRPFNLFRGAEFVGSFKSEDAARDKALGKPRVRK